MRRCDADVGLALVKVSFLAPKTAF